jgi:maltooligosyltrehalose trehalohydrolase
VNATRRVWAPRAKVVHVVTADGRYELQPGEPDGWWQGEVPDPAADYAFALDGGEPRPDPRSPCQPHGVHGPSRPIDHTGFEWTDHDWRGKPVGGGVIYELHIGTFTPEGTFDAAVQRLDHLVELGVDFVEVMPVNAFPGRWGWGYDGVDLYAVHTPYGGPDGLKTFVNACHGNNLGVILDVVYNHLGPDGNYLQEFGPYFTDKHTTPWGAAVNLDDDGSPEVRAFLIDNALHWLRNYHLDGLRLDAVHAFVDESPTHFLAELADRVSELGAQLDRSLFLIAESDDNEPRTIESRRRAGHGMDAQWSDDFHHALHAALTGERDGYYGDFGALAGIAAALTDGFVYTGQHSAYRGRPHGAPLPPETSGHRLLGYLQNHDQIGNRARGERTSALLSTGLLQIGAALVLTSPFTPMLFMGEEWGATTPWQYFTDHEDKELAAAVRDGRRSEFAAFGWAPDDVPNPQDATTFERSRLDWTERTQELHRTLLEWHRALIRLRMEWPELRDGDLRKVKVQYDEEARWLTVLRGRIAVICNLSDKVQAVPLPIPAADTGLHQPRVLLASTPPMGTAGSEWVVSPQSVVLALV